MIIITIMSLQFFQQKDKIKNYRKHHFVCVPVFLNFFCPPPPFSGLLKNLQKTSGNDHSIEHRLGRNDSR